MTAAYSKIIFVPYNYLYIVYYCCTQILQDQSMEVICAHAKVLTAAGLISHKHF
jgi:hypothetical protein